MTFTSSITSTILHKHREVLESWILNSENDDLVPEYWSFDSTNPSYERLYGYVALLCMVVVKAKQRGYTEDAANYYTQWFPERTLRVFGMADDEVVY